MANLKTVATFLGALLLTASSAMAAERTLFTLESTPTQKPVALSVLDVKGIQRPEVIPALRRWTLKPGDRLRVDARPADRVVDLFTGTRLSPSLLCHVVLRYYRSNEGWTPRFRLDEEPAVAFINGRWQPLGGIAGLVRFGNLLPNAEGFFSTIEFGASAGNLAIVAWQVR